MPQLDTVYILSIYLWTWLMIYITTQKIKTFMMTKSPLTNTTPKKPTQTLQWL